MKYKRTKEATAVQYTGQTIKELTSVFEIKPGIRDLELLDRTDWLILENGEFSVYTDSSFKKHFKKVL